MNAQSKIDSQNLCPMYEKAVRIVGKPWTALIIRALLDGPRRFGEITSYIGPASDSIVSARLKELEREGIIERRVYPDTPVRIEYILTAKATGLKEVVEAIQLWAEKL